MPSGRYVVLGKGGEPEGEEAFRCAPGPAGWRYVAEITGAGEGAVDLVADAGWNVVRVLFRSPGGELLLERPWRTDLHLDVFSPVTNVVSTRRIAGTADIDVLYVERETLETSLVRQRYELLGDEPVQTAVGRFTATRWRFTALASGWTSDLWIAGDVVVRYERLFELTQYNPGSTGPRPAA